MLDPTSTIRFARRHVRGPFLVERWLGASAAAPWSSSRKATASTQDNATTTLLHGSVNGQSWNAIGHEGGLMGVFAARMSNLGKFGSVSSRSPDTHAFLSVSPVFGLRLGSAIG